MIVVRIVIDNEPFIENNGVFVCPKKSLCQLNDQFKLFTTKFYTALYAHPVHVQPYEFPQ